MKDRTNYRPEHINIAIRANPKIGGQYGTAHHYYLVHTENKIYFSPYNSPIAHTIFLTIDTIKINVNKQMEGYSFSITPSIRDFIKKIFPNAHPANNIFVGYDTKSDFEVYVNKLESHIYPALLGVDNENDLNQFDDIQFIDTQTGSILHKLTPRDEKI
jgi:hypothetical protein